MKALVVGFLTIGLYLITALVTGLHNFYWLMNMINGAPLNVLNLAAFVGSVTLLVAAVFLSFRSRLAAKIGLAGSILLWVYYGPLITISFSMPFTLLNEIRSFIYDREFVPLIGMLLGPILLIACTVDSMLSFKRDRHFHQIA